jgi:hypothetical protein
LASLKRKASASAILPVADMEWALLFVGVINTESNSGQQTDVADLLFSKKWTRIRMKS